MLLSADRFEAVFQKVKQIREHMRMYCLVPDRAKMSIEDLQWCIGDMYDLKIEKFEVAFDSIFLYGMVERYPGRARILVRKDQPEDSMRFVTTKELCQLALDEREDWSPRGTETLDALLSEFKLDLEGANEDSREVAKGVAQSERLAEFAAIELMYPFEYRENDAVQVKEGKITIKAIALHFHVPEFVIGRALHSRHLTLARAGWDSVAEASDKEKSVRK